ncbi:DUF6455 family protein [Roseivivax sp. CAU 1753]
MTLDLFETTLRAFEDRMLLRRRMLHVTGAVPPSGPVSASMADDIRRSIVNCHTCTGADICAPWLDDADVGAQPPEFCPNRHTILRLRASGHHKETKT